MINDIFASETSLKKFFRPLSSRAGWAFPCTWIRISLVHLPGHCHKTIILVPDVHSVIPTLTRLLPDTCKTFAQPGRSSQHPSPTDFGLSLARHTGKTRPGPDPFSCHQARAGLRPLPCCLPPHAWPHCWPAWPWLSGFRLSSSGWQRLAPSFPGRQ